MDWIAERWRQKCTWLWEKKERIRRSEPTNEKKTTETESSLAHKSAFHVKIDFFLGFASEKKNSNNSSINIVVRDVENFLKIDERANMKQQQKKVHTNTMVHIVRLLSCLDE